VRRTSLRISRRDLTPGHTPVPNGPGDGPVHRKLHLPKLAVIIVSHQVRDLLRACLLSVRAQRPAPHEIWVVDNASTDGSAALVAAEFPEVRLVTSEENLGFGRANNLAMARADADVFALVNPDTVLPPDALATALETFERHPDAGIVGVALENPDGTRQPSRFAFPDLANLLVESLGLHRVLARVGFATTSRAPERDGAETPSAWVSGACLLATRRLFEQTGGFDERLFLYGEELDWCWRARAAGHSVWHTSRTRVLHHGGASGVRARGALFVRNIEGRLAFMRRHRGAWRAAVARELVTLGAVLRWWAWRARAALEGRPARERTREQLERFSAVWAWRVKGGR